MSGITLGQIYSALGIIVAAAGVLTAFGQIVKKAVSKIYQPVTDLTNKLTSGFDKIEKDISIIKTGLQSSLRRQILTTCEECIAAGYIDIDQMEWLSKAYIDYESLGENGFVTELYERTMDLPVK